MCRIVRAEGTLKNLNNLSAFEGSCSQHFCEEQQTWASAICWEVNVYRHLVWSFCAQNPTLLFHIQIEFSLVLWINNICCNSRKISSCATFFQILIFLALASAPLPLKDRIISVNYIYFAFFSFMAVEHFVGPWPLFSFLILYTVGRTPWTGDQPVARPLPTHTTTQTQNKHTDIHASSGIRTHVPSVLAGEEGLFSF
jgi:hypothetical protein